MIDESMFQDRVERLKKLQEPECIVEEDASPVPFNFLRLLTYPFNAPGLSVTAVYVLLPFLLWMVIMILPGALRFSCSILLLLIKILIALSTLWYPDGVYSRQCRRTDQSPRCCLNSARMIRSGTGCVPSFLLLAIIAVCISPAFIIRYFWTDEPVLFFGILGTGFFFLRHDAPGGGDVRYD